jgi:hypothetical protein
MFRRGHAAAVCREHHVGREAGPVEPVDEHAHQRPFGRRRPALQVERLEDVGDVEGVQIRQVDGQQTLGMRIRFDRQMLDI